MNKLVQTILIEIQRRMDILWERLPDADDVLAGNATTEQMCDTAAYKELEQLETFINNMMFLNRDTRYCMSFYYGTTKDAWENIKKQGHLSSGTCLHRNKEDVHRDYILEVRYNPYLNVYENDYTNECEIFAVIVPIPLDNIDCIMSPELKVLSDNLPDTVSFGGNEYHLHLCEGSGMFSGWFSARYADNNGNVPQVHTDGFIEFLCCMDKDRKYIIEDMQRRIRESGCQCLDSSSSTTD